MTGISTGLFESKILAPEGEKVPVWLARPYQLVSLLEMYPFHLKLFHMTTLLLAKYEALLSSPHRKAEVELITDEAVKVKALEIIENTPEKAIDTFGKV